jgi:hypothetical protein
MAATLLPMTTHLSTTTTLRFRELNVEAEKKFSRCNAEKTQKCEAHSLSKEALPRLATPACQLIEFPPHLIRRGPLFRIPPTASKQVSNRNGGGIRIRSGLIFQIGVMGSLRSTAARVNFVWDRRHWV